MTSRIFYTVAGLLLASGMFQGCGSSPSPSSASASYPTPEGVLAVGNLLWQDQPLNAQNKSFSLKEAAEYCRRLELADVKGWRLPAIKEAARLLPHIDKLRYKSDGFYLSATPICPYKGVKTDDPLKVLFSPLYLAAETLEKSTRVLESDTSCTYALWKNQKLELLQSKHGRVRCVTNIERFNEAQRKKAEKIAALEATHTYDAYIELYRMTHDLRYIKQAYAVADTMEKKIKAERLLVEQMKEKIFDIIGGKDGPSKLTTQKANVLGVIAGGALTDKDFVKSFTVKSDFLEYGTYRVKIKFILKLHYDAVMFGIGTSTTETESQIVTFTLSPKNRFRQTKTVRFKRVPASMQESVGGIGAVRIELKNAELMYEVVGVE